MNKQIVINIDENLNTGDLKFDIGRVYTDNEVLNIWNTLGFTEGVKEENKLRLSRWYEEMARYLIKNEKELNDNENIYKGIDVIAFPCIRKFISQLEQIQKYENNHELLCKEISEYFKEQTPYLEEIKKYKTDIDIEAELLNGFCGNKHNFKVLLDAFKVSTENVENS